MRGYAVIGLDNPKDGKNVGGTLRAAGIFGALLVAISGPRKRHFMNHPTDTMKAYRSVPTVFTDELFDAIPYACIPVAVDLIDGAIPLPIFVHPERAFYIFGAEDNTLGKRITDRCRYKVMIPSDGCLNLAAAVNVILYDRISKQCRGQASLRG